MGLLRDAREWVGALRALGGRARRPGPPPAPAAARRPVARPEDDPALGSALERWKGRPPISPSGLGADEERAAMAHLEELRGRMPPAQRDAIAAHLAAGAVAVRRLGPQDGYLWEMPGARVFAIVGVQAFSVEDPPPP